MDVFEKTAREIMVPLKKYPHAHDSQTLREAVELLDGAQIEIGGRKSMPRILLVFDADHQLVGMVRRRDILRGLEPDYHGGFDTAHPEAHFKTEIDPNLSELVGPEDTGRLRRKLERPLSEVVRDMPGQVNAADSILKVVRELVARDSHIAVVVEDDQVIGVVRSLDLLHVVTETLS